MASNQKLEIPPAPSERTQQQTASVINLATEMNSPARRQRSAPAPPPMRAISQSPSQREREVSSYGTKDSEQRGRLESYPDSTGFVAQIEGASMADLVQLECLSGLTRALRVIAGDRTGLLFFDEGQLVHAVAGPLAGEEAALEILSWETGSVRPSDSYWVNPPSIQRGWQGLLLAAAQLKDEAQRHRSDSKSIANKFVSESDEMLSPKAEGSAPGLLRAVRLNQEGQLLSGEGDISEFADAASYCVRLAQLVGDGLGLEDFHGLESTGCDKVFVAFWEGDELVAVEAEAGANLSELRRNAGT